MRAASLIWIAMLGVGCAHPVESTDCTSCIFTLDQISRNPEHFDGRRVTVRAFIADYGFSNFYDVMSAEVELSAGRLFCRSHGYIIVDGSDIVENRLQARERYVSFEYEFSAIFHNRQFNFYQGLERQSVGYFSDIDIISPQGRICFDRTS
jgi:hypothetical protein